VRSRRRCWDHSEVLMLRNETWNESDLAPGWQQRVRLCARPRKRPGPPGDPGPWNERGAMILTRVRAHQYGPIPLPFTHRRRRR